MGKAIPYGVLVQIGKCLSVCCLKRLGREPISAAIRLIG